METQWKSDSFIKHLTVLLVNSHLSITKGNLLYRKVNDLSLRLNALFIA